MIRCEHFPKNRGEHARIFDSLAGSLGLEGRRGVVCVSHDGYTAFAKERESGDVEESPAGDVGLIKKLRWSAKRGSEHCKSGIEMPSPDFVQVCPSP